ncbi:MAG: DMT family transporter [Patescibacteria group bacterium]|mgnify:CR=1 FL=1
MWLLFAFLSPAFYAIAEIFDNFLVNKEFKHPLTLVFYTFLFNILFIPVLFIFSPPTLPPLHTLPIFIILGLVGIGYMYPYYKGLRADDTSVAISFFAIGRIFVPVLAFLIVGEILDFQQYAGIALIIISVVALGIHHSRKRFRFSKAVWYIGSAAFLLAFEGVFLKLLFENGVSVSTAVAGESLIGLLLALCLPISGKIRKDIRASFPLFIKLSPLFLIEEAFTFLGTVTEGAAISLTSLSVVKGITMVSPFFLVIYAWAGHSVFPNLFKEDLHRRKIVRKLLLFALLIMGIILVKE